MSTLTEQAKEIGVCSVTLKSWIIKNNIAINQKGTHKWISDEDFQKAKSVLQTQKSIRTKTEELKKKGLRHCKVCKKEGNKDNFLPDENLCNDCYKERSKRYYNNHKDHIKRKVREYAVTNEDKVKESGKRYRRSNKNRIKLYFVKWAYNLSPEEYELLLQNNNGFCPICNIKSENLCIDHDHNTKRVRGMICSSCNLGLGNFHDDIDYLKKCIKYLTKLNNCNVKYDSKKIRKEQKIWLDKYNNKCGICGRKEKLGVDHDHQNGFIRGVLCNTCNLGLGIFEDSLTNIGNAISYLERHNEC